MPLPKDGDGGPVTGTSSDDSTVSAAVSPGPTRLSPQKRTPEPVEPASNSMRCLVMGMIFLARIEVSVLHLTIPAVAKEFNVSLESAAWISMSSNFAVVMSGPLAGKWSDMMGPALTWRRGVILLVLSTWLTGIAWNFPVLMIGRILCGVSQSLVFAPGMPLMARGMSLQYRGVVSAHIKTMDTLGAGIGIFVGGLFVEYFNWRWIFLGPAPVMTIVWICSFWVIKVPPSEQAYDKRKLQRFDWAGTLLFTLTSFFCLFALNRGNDMGWTDRVVLGMGVSTLVLIPILAWVEMRAEEPFLAMSVFSGANRMVPFAASLCSACCFLTTMMMWPIFLQQGLQINVGSVGELLAMRPFAAAIQTSIVTGLLSKAEVSKLMLARVGALIMCVATCSLGLISHLSPGFLLYTAIVVQLFMQSLGHFMCTLANQSLVLAATPAAEIASANQLRMTLGNIAGLLGQTVNLSIVGESGFKPDSYSPCWIMLGVISILTLVLCFMISDNVEAATRNVTSPERPTRKSLKQELKEPIVQKFGPSFDTPGDLSGSSAGSAKPDGSPNAEPATTLSDATSLSDGDKPALGLSSICKS